MWGAVCGPEQKKGCPGWAPFGRFWRAKPRENKSAAKESGLPQEQHRQKLFKAPRALCKTRAKSQSVTNNPVAEGVGMEYASAHLCKVTSLRLEGEVPWACHQRGLVPGNFSAGGWQVPVIGTEHTPHSGPLDRQSRSPC